MIKLATRDIVDFKWNEVEVRNGINGKKLYWVELLDHKFMKAHEVEQKQFIPIYNQTYELLQRLGLKEKIGTNEYVLAPKVENRKGMKKVLGDSFRWYWRDVAEMNPKVKYKSLRSTFITLATNLAGDQYQLIQKHTQADTTRKHYYDKSVAVSEMFEQDFYNLKIA
jgi:hypothetical protein